ncbi:hypothetical protein FGIG_03587 [Fasciola gigantica]|uniref:Uncharacterized protein n=1 Tax=Fasciola gigantica TaxID=46835 RepID=A0A504YI17_FASGI|nr:hypothetical protein FGIG_03587 [Fasciola gigantica]
MVDVQLFPTKFFDDASDDLKSFLRIVSAPCGKLTDFANISHQFGAETWLSSIVLDALIPACFNSTSIVACIAARDFVKDILLGNSNSLIPLVNTQSFKVFVGSDSEWINETIVFIYQVFRLWRRAMKAQSKLNQSDNLSHNTCIQRALLDTAEFLLIRSPTAFIHCPDEDSLPPVVIVQLMLRSLRALSKSLCAFVQDAHVLTLRTQLDQLIFTISCSSTSDNTNLSPCVEFLLSELTPAVSLFQNNNNTLCGSEQTIDSLRRLLLLDLDLAWRTGI